MENCGKIKDFGFLYIYIYIIACCASHGSPPNGFNPSGSYLDRWKNQRI